MEKFAYPIIIDTDIGDDIDDTWAVVYMIASKLFDIRGIVVTNYDTKYKAALTAKILTDLKRTDIPIYVSPPTPLPQSYRRAQEPYAKKIDMSKYAGRVIEQDSIAQLAHDITLQNERVAIMELATNTSLAALIKVAPDIYERTFVYAMAGAVDGSYEGCDHVVAEFNVAIDLAASQRVFSSRLNYTLLPLDVCNNIRIKGDLYKEFLQCQTTPAKIIQENYFDWIEGSIFENDNDFNLSSSRLFDLIVPFYALMSQNFLVKKECIYVNEQGITCRGGDKPIDWARNVNNMDDMLQNVVAAFKNWQPNENIQSDDKKTEESI